MTRVFLSRQSKNDPKRFSIGCILTIYKNKNKNFLLLLFFYCFRIMCGNRYLARAVLKLFDIQEEHKVYVIYGGVIQRCVE
jgi:hypothetical protein